MLISAAVLLVGCSTGPRVQVVKEGRLLERMPEAISGQVELSLSNAGTLELQLLEYHYTVNSPVGGSWSGRQAGDGDRSPEGA